MAKSTRVFLAALAVSVTFGCGGGSDPVVHNGAASGRGFIDPRTGQPIAGAPSPFPFPTFQPASILIQNADPPGWGLNDLRPFQAIGGNNSRTLGEARLNAARRAAQVWGAILQSRTPIVLKMSFNHEPCGAPGTANGGFATTLADFPGSRPGVHYPPALANAIAGRDLNGSDPEGGIEILAVFDDQPGCIGQGWYYGFDHPNQFTKYGLDFISAVLHEMGHVFGFMSQTAPDPAGAAITPFELHMYDETLRRFWPDLTPAERVSASRNVHNLTWNGPSTNLAASRYAPATTNGHLRLAAGTNCTSHWEPDNTGGYVGLLMSGSGNNEVRSDFVDVTSCALQDMGWTLTSPLRCPDVAAQLPLPQALPFPVPALPFPVPALPFPAPAAPIPTPAFPSTAPPLPSASPGSCASGELVDPFTAQCAPVCPSGAPRVGGQCWP